MPNRHREPLVVKGHHAGGPDRDTRNRDVRGSARPASFLGEPAAAHVLPVVSPDFQATTPWCGEQDG